MATGTYSYNPADLKGNTMSRMRLPLPLPWNEGNAPPDRLLHEACHQMNTHH